MNSSVRYSAFGGETFSKFSESYLKRLLSAISLLLLSALSYNTLLIGVVLIVGAVKPQLPSQLHFIIIGRSSSIQYSLRNKFADGTRIEVLT